jgi:protein-tyrosine phosphatase
MLPPLDTHVHLLAGRDDGPATLDESVAMARMLVAEGVRGAAALAHQNDTYPENTPAQLRDTAAQFAAAVKEAKIPLAVYPTGEVMASADLAERAKAGQYLSVADRGQYLLVEQPHRIYIDYVPLAKSLHPLGLRIIVAHAERYPELLHDAGAAEKLIALGCLIQVTASALAEPPTARDEKAMKNWVLRGIVHLVGTDGHNLDRRPPRMAAGMNVLRKWAGPGAADRIGNIFASGIVQGRPLNPPRPAPIQRSWFSKLFGG